MNRLIVFWILISCLACKGDHELREHCRKQGGVVETYKGKKVCVKDKWVLFEWPD